MRSFGPILLCVSLGLLCAAGGIRAVPIEIDDADVTNFITTKLLADDAVDGHLIDVSTEDGVVTLSGSADNLLEKDKAAELAGSVKGVRSVINRIDVTPWRRDDLEIYEDVVEALHTDPATEAYELTVSVSDGVVTLGGEVDSWAEKVLSRRVVKSVRGVKAVEDAISVRAHPGKRPDAEIRADVLRSMETDVWIDASDVGVSVRDGRVKLTGTVGSAAEKSRAYLDAFVEGVGEVDDGALRVDWGSYDPLERDVKVPPDLSGEEIEEAIHDAFLRDPRVLAFSPEIEVDDGVVVLTGVVDNLAAKNAAEQTALNTVGVWRVNNFLRVRPDNMPEDPVIADRIRRALRRNPYTEPHEIEVSVRNGLVDLRGTVDSRFEMIEASRAASKVSGVIEVDNHLVVRYGYELVEVKDDWELKDDVEAALWWSPYVPSEDITVTVDRGVVTLEGRVDTWNQRQRAKETAEEAGARKVVNKLTVDLYGPDYYHEEQAP